MGSWAKLKMAHDNWFRNEQWNAEIAAAFRAKLSRARSYNRPPYMRIQAGYFTGCYPQAALQLIDEYLAMGAHFYIAMAGRKQTLAAK